MPMFTWKATAEEINKLPIEVRQYIHTLTDLRDPEMLKRENMELTDLNTKLKIENHRLESEVAALRRTFGYSKGTM